MAIAHKLRRDVAAALPSAEIIFYHGYQSQKRREDVFRRLAVQKTPCLVVGTRSALFLPLPSLGIIFIDEEHDASFKQEDHVPYQAKEIAWFRAARENAVLVLGSATPDLKTCTLPSTTFCLFSPCRTGSTIRRCPMFSLWT